MCLVVFVIRVFINKNIGFWIYLGFCQFRFLRFYCIVLLADTVCLQPWKCQFFHYKNRLNPLQGIKYLSPDTFLHFFYSSVNWYMLWHFPIYTYFFHLLIKHRSCKLKHLISKSIESYPKYLTN